MTDQTEDFIVVNRWTREVQFTAQIAIGLLGSRAKMGAAVKWAVGRGADLRNSDLRDVDFSGADLRGSDLSGCDLRGSDLSGCDLRGSDLSGCDLRNADLRGSNLSGSNLSGANLSGANLSCFDLRNSDLSNSDLSGADLSGVDLSGANLSRSNLRPIRADLFDVLVLARAEAPAFLAALRAGKVNGSTYEGTCACLVGTLANARGVNYHTMAPDSLRPIERFVMGIELGDTPETNPISALVAEWTALFIGEVVA